MNNEFPIHILGKIFWLPPHRPGKPLFPPETSFRALAKFTSDFSPSYTVLASYSSLVSEQGFHEVRINVTFGKVDDIQRLTKNSELIILDGYKVIAVCRDLNFAAFNGNQIDDPWHKSND